MSDKRYDYEQEIIRLWGDKEHYFKTLEEFYETHRNKADVIEFDNELNMPIRAVYLFAPVKVARENVDLMEKIRQAADENP